MSSIPSSLVLGLEQNVVVLLGSKGSNALLKFIPHEDLVLVCYALAAVMHSLVPRQTPLLSRVSDIVENILTTLALNTVLAYVIVPHDPVLTCANLTMVYLLSHILLPPTATLSDTAQYLLVYNLSSALQGFKETGMALAWTMAFTPHAFSSLVGPDATNLARLVVIETLANWLRAWLPSSLLLPTTLVLLYLCAPFADDFPPLRRLFRFAVFAVTNDKQTSGVPHWLVVVALWAISRLDPDPIGRTFAIMAGASVGVTVILDAMQFAVDKDPGATLMAMLVAIRILERVVVARSA